MIHAQDTFSKFLEAGLAAKGVEVVANPEGPLGVNKVNILFLDNTPDMLVTPTFASLLVSLDVIGAETSAVMSRRRAMALARAVDEVLTSFSIPKEDYTNPASPVPLGSNMMPEFWGAWRRLPDPDNRLEHWNRTLTVRYFEERR